MYLEIEIYKQPNKYSNTIKHLIHSAYRWNKSGEIAIVHYDFDDDIYYVYDVINLKYGIIGPRIALMETLVDRLVSTGDGRAFKYRNAKMTKLSKFELENVLNRKFILEMYLVQERSVVGSV